MTGSRGQRAASAADTWAADGFTIPMVPTTTVGTVSLPLAMPRTTAAASGCSQMFTRSWAMSARSSWRNRLLQKGQPGRQ